ncbi:MAG: hypothetical protein HQ559_05525 [Lentisphaerae bacterium]|nr:hypothetical protein [Lentisphaerota bacterium]
MENVEDSSMEKEEGLKKQPFEEPEVTTYDREELDVHTVFAACPESGCGV